jgi:phosphoribosylformylglycinamidine synthase subunit PurQ / glutaminase
MMPHPERNMFFFNRDDWTLIRERARREGKKIPDEGDGMMIFRNAAGYFR